MNENIDSVRYSERYSRKNESRKRVMMNSLSAIHYKIIHELLLANDDAKYQHCMNASDLLVNKYMKIMHKYIDDTYFVDKD